MIMITQLTRRNILLVIQNKAIKKKTPNLFKKKDQKFQTIKNMYCE